MATSQSHNDGNADLTPQEQVVSSSYEQPTTDAVGTEKLDEADIAPGRIVWLPAKEQLPKGAVWRVRGTGAIEEGTYSHPVVIISRPTEQNHLVHFQLITSLQGKTLDHVYYKSSEYHTTRRSWYLPIAPTPDHPDITSNKTKKRFPTLKLADGAALRCDSYVNIRNVYAIDWSLLETYAETDIRSVQPYRFERDSLMSLLAKTTNLTQYEPNPQVRSQSNSKPVSQSTGNDEASKENGPNCEHSEVLPMSSTPAEPLQLDGCLLIERGHRIIEPSPEIPPDTKAANLWPLATIWRPFDQLLDVKGAVSEAKHVVKPFNSSFLVNRVDQFWVDLKGVTAVVIASM